MASLSTELEILLSKIKKEVDDRPDFDFIIPPSILDDFSDPGSGNSPGSRVSPVPTPNPSRTEQFGPSIPTALMEVINNPAIMVTEEMLPIINDDSIVVTREGQPAKKMSGRDVIRSSGQFSRAALLPDLPKSKTKKKRKVSKYQKEFGLQLKKLKAKHPRSKISSLMKRAHAATRKALK